MRPDPSEQVPSEEEWRLGLALRALILAIFFVPAVVVLTMRDADPKSLAAAANAQGISAAAARNLRLRSRRAGFPAAKEAQAATTMKD